MALQDNTVGGEYRYDWMDQYWASNILLATLTDGGTFHSQAQIFLKYWICGTDEVSLGLICLHSCLSCFPSRATAVKITGLWQTGQIGHNVFGPVFRLSLQKRHAEM